MRRGIALSLRAVAAALTLSATSTALADVPATQPAIRDLTGSVSDVRIAIPAARTVERRNANAAPAGVDLHRMSQWAMNYLIETPRKELGYEPVFQCHPLQCPPAPRGQDPVVACDTDARMDWEWYFMREISGSDAGRDVEAAFHQRIRDYIDADGKVWSHPGAFNEGNTTIRYQKSDNVIHIWGATKILKSLSEDYARTGNAESKALARKVMLALKKLATWDDAGRCWFACGMGAFNADGTVAPNGWNRQPAPIVEPLVTYWLATHDDDALAFAKAYTEGMLNGCQPDGLRFREDGSFDGHSHATMHAVWGVAHLGLVTNEKRYIDFARGAWRYMLSRGTGTGWFPAGPDNCNETCCISDMMSVAALLGRAGEPAYYDCVERYLRNYIAPLQFIITPDFESMYRRRNASRTPAELDAGLKELRKFQGGIIGGSGLNDYENALLGGVSGFEMFGCCAPEGMRAIYTTWTNTIEHRDASDASPAGVYVNMNFARESTWGRVMADTDAGRMSVDASVSDAFLLRPPAWAPKTEVHAFVNAKPVPTIWAGDYVRFDAKASDELTILFPVVEFTQKVSGLWASCAPNLTMTFRWHGNRVIESAPVATGTPLFAEAVRALPDTPSH